MQLWPPAQNQIASVTALAEHLSEAHPEYDTEWRQHLSDLLRLPVSCIPRGNGMNVSESPPEAEVPRRRPLSAARGSRASIMLNEAAGVVMLKSMLDEATHHSYDDKSNTPLKGVGGGSFVSRRGSATLVDQRTPSSTGLVRGITAKLWTTVENDGGDAAAVNVPEPQHASSSLISQKASLDMLTEVVRGFTHMYGPVVVLLENLHDFDTWSWQLLVQLAEDLSNHVILIATTRPNNTAAGPGVNQDAESGQQLHGKAAMYQRVATLYRHLQSLKTTNSILLTPFNFEQTKELMQVWIRKCSMAFTMA